MWHRIGFMLERMWLITSFDIWGFHSDENVDYGLWAATLCCLVVCYQCFRRMYCLQLQGRSSTLKMEMTCSSKTLVRLHGITTENTTVHIFMLAYKVTVVPIQSCGYAIMQCENTERGVSNHMYMSIQLVGWNYTRHGYFSLLHVLT
jgi:hypothetical protein